ncbi:DUF983 domain-containing protein [Flavobacterium sp. xlx-214]|uniref:DUF983 domain-containing protein n=1 Tax=unclassified Flavobacterium TaxID=196869 RepID=UPI0013CF5DD4|nr:MULTISPECIES: DUF983 domain-containing protein [unclassified Flavobacterium]MBA5791839.1 DUF983 domain-containing protein [Flavobacterium sp. xlx-221]QMI83076.1 DUF983 domain-containing protein [Flavobacterium sp. xlx-214]
MSYVSNVLKGTCPNCGETKVFKEKGNPLIFKMPVMHEKCHKCNYSFHREPGFYFGAMYMSYALTVAEMVSVFVLGLLAGVGFLKMFFAVIVVVFLLSTFNFRISRLMWLNLFYEKEEEGEVQK